MELRRIVGDLEAAMKLLQKAGEGVPYRPAGFANVRKQLARTVGEFAVELETSASLFGNGKSS
jgi:hypothetical protein